jgi:RNA polymerase sigma-70 factor, ECF subfamily
MSRSRRTAATGLEILRCAVAELLLPAPLLATSGTTTSPTTSPPAGSSRGIGRSTGDEPDYPPETDESSRRVAALVDLARDGDAEAFGHLYDHYCPSVYRFVFYRVSSQALAEDLTSETFFRALRSMTGFQWQGKDFGAWLMTIARNLVVDHYKSGRARLETVTDSFRDHDRLGDEGPEEAVIAGLTNEILLEALSQLPEEQQTCLVMRFLNEKSIAETAQVLGRSDGAVKQLQLRAVRNLAKLMPDGLR